MIKSTSKSAEESGEEESGEDDVATH